MVDLVKGKEISKVSSGGSIPIDGFQALNHSADLVTLSDDTVWLKTGVIETDTALYPDAKVTNECALLEEIFYHLQTSDIRSMAWDGTYFYSLCNLRADLYRYTSDFSSRTTVSTTINNAQYLGMCFNGTQLVAVRSDKLVRKFTTTGTESAFFTASQVVGTIAGIVWDGVAYWVLDGTNQVLYKYDSAGTYLNTTIDVSVQGSTAAWRVAFDGTYLIVIATPNGTTNGYKYALDGTYASIVLNNLKSSYVFSDNVSLFAFKQSTNIYKQALTPRYVGNIEPQYEGETPKYVRVK